MDRATIAESDFPLMSDAAKIDVLKFRRGGLCSPGSQPVDVKIPYTTISKVTGWTWSPAQPTGIKLTTTAATAPSVFGKSAKIPASNGATQTIFYQSNSDIGDASQASLLTTTDFTGNNRTAATAIAVRHGRPS